MRLFTKKNSIQTFAVFFVLVILFFIIQPTTKPWEDGGKLLLIVQATPQEISETALGFGIDNVELIKSDGTKLRVHVRTRRIILDPNNMHIEIVVDDTVPVGTYTGFSFSIQSPEIRADWEEQAPPIHISLAGEHISILSPFHIEKNITSALLLTFETHQALHEDNGTKMYLPVIQVETRFNIEPIATENKNATIQGGIIESNATYGMDWNGTMRFNFRAQNKEPVREETIPQELLNTLQDENATNTPLSTATTSEETSNEEKTSSSSVPEDEFEVF